MDCDLKISGGGSVEKGKVDFQVSPGWGRMRAREEGATVVGSPPERVTT